MAQGQGAGVRNAPVFQRSFVQVTLDRKVRSVYDFAYGQYVALRNFFDQLSDIQASLVQGDVVNLGTGQQADISTVGGALAIQIYMETLESAKESTVGLAKLGLKNENKLWTLQ